VLTVLYTVTRRVTEVYTYVSIISVVDGKRRRIARVCVRVCELDGVVVVVVVDGEQQVVVTAKVFGGLRVVVVYTRRRLPSAMLPAPLVYNTRTHTHTLARAPRVRIIYIILL